jgi:hypothetical protein
MAENRDGTRRDGRRPKRPEERRRMVSVSLYGPQVEKLQRAAARRGTNVSEVLRCLVEAMPPAGPASVRTDYPKGGEA